LRWSSLFSQRLRVCSQPLGGGPGNAVVIAGRARRAGARVALFTSVVVIASIDDNDVTKLDPPTSAGQ
jgi:hypothetical protein